MVAVASQIDELTPEETCEILAKSGSAALVDVRTRAEWSFVGVPDLRSMEKPLWTIEWVSFPTMQPNPHFVEQLMEVAGQSLPDHLFFICRSGARSMAAARQVAAETEASGNSIRCTNVAEGFEGDLDASGHRGTLNGWKVRGLPWTQS